MVESRRRGLTLQQIATQEGLTRERVRQVLNKMGGPSSAEVRAAQSAQRATAAQELKRRVLADLQQHPGSTHEEVAARLGIDRSEVHPHVPAHMRALIVHPTGSVEQRWSDDEIFAALNAAATYAYPLTSQAYADLVGSGEVHGPSLPRVWQRFGSWMEACRAAGVESGRPRRDNYQSKWTDEDIRDFVRRFLGDPEYGGTFAEYDRWRRARGVDAPSSALLRQRLGTWSEIKRSVLAS